jgi:hypothetical protein
MSSLIPAYKRYHPEAKRGLGMPSFFTKIAETNLDRALHASVFFIGLQHPKKRPSGECRRAALAKI